VKNKGVGTPALVAIIVVVVAVVGVGGYLLLKGDDEEVGLPVYPGSESYDIPGEYFGSLEIPDQVKIEGFNISGAGFQEVLNWYSDHMEGWTIEDEYQTWAHTGGQLYRKGAKGAGVVAMGGTGLAEGTVYLLAIGPWSKFEEADLVDKLVERGTPPALILYVTAEQDDTNIVITIEHQGGDDLVLDEFTVKAGDDPASLTEVPLADGTLSVGETTTVTWSDASTTDNVITVYVIYAPTNTKMWSSSNVIVG
jgi:hypothetical protein